MSAAKKVLITGAGGFIGSRLSSYLRTKGREVIEYTADINDRDSLERCGANADAVIHLAAKCDKARPGREGDDYMGVNVVGTENVAELCLRHGSTLVFFSSISAEKHGDLYGLSKYLAEHLVRFYSATKGLPAVIIRPCGIYDENNRDRLGRPMDFSKGRHYPIALLVRDVDALLRTHDFHGECTILTPKNLWNYYVLYWLKRIRNRLQRIYVA